MRNLEKLLDSIVAQTTFDLGRVVIKNGLVRISYDSRSGKGISPEQLRRIFNSNRWDDQELDRVRDARLITPDESISKLCDHLRQLLKDYIDPETDRIGFALPSLSQDGQQTDTFQRNGLKSIECVSSVKNFAKGLIKGAVVLGTKRMTSLLLGWSKGKPIKYRTSAIINELRINKSFAPVAGVHIEPLPLSTDKLPAYLPRCSGMSITDYLGLTVLSIDCTASPVLFRPNTGQSEQNVQATAIRNIDIDTVCQALSLESDSFADTAFLWNDYQEFAAFTLTNANLSWSTGLAHYRGRSDEIGMLNTDFTTGVTTLILNEQSAITNLTETRLRKTLKSLDKLGSNRMRIAVSRWMKSKDSSKNLEDRFIDLRIALESLYLKDFLKEHSQEMRFRIALFGAWHLGADFRDRRSIRKRLRDAYDKASKAVHGDDLDFNPENQKLLSDGQDLCRRGILKLLREAPLPDWGDLILGVEDDSNSA